MLSEMVVASEHVTVIDLLWRASARSLADPTRNAPTPVGLRSIAFPIIGAGSGGFEVAESERIMLESIAESCELDEVVIVRFREKAGRQADPRS